MEPNYVVDKTPDGWMVYDENAQESEPFVVCKQSDESFAHFVADALNAAA